jgi:hypothetical protein
MSEPDSMKSGREKRRQAIADTRRITDGGTRLDLRIYWYAKDVKNGGGSIHAPGAKDGDPFKDTEALLQELREIVELARPRLHMVPPEIDDDQPESTGHERARIRLRRPGG